MCQKCAKNKKTARRGMILSFKAEEELEKLRDKAISLNYSPSDIIDGGAKPKHFTLADPDGIIIEFSV